MPKSSASSSSPAAPSYKIGDKVTYYPRGKGVNKKVSILSFSLAKGRWVGGRVAKRGADPALSSFFLPDYRFGTYLRLCFIFESKLIDRLLYLLRERLSTRLRRIKRRKSGRTE